MADKLSNADIKTLNENQDKNKSNLKPRNLRSLIPRNSAVEKTLNYIGSPANINQSAQSGRISPIKTVGIMDLLKYQIEEKRLLELQSKLKDKEMMNLIIQKDEDLNNFDNSVFK